MIVILIVIALVIVAIAIFALQKNRVPTTQARAYAIALAIVFFAGAGTHRLLEHRPDSVALVPVPTVVDPADTPNTAPSGRLDIGALALSGPKTVGSVDIVEVEKDGALHVRGWAIAVSGRPATALVAILDHTTRVDITSLYGRPRPDVVAALKNPSARNSGFEGNIPLPTLHAGPHSVDIVVASPDSDAFQYPSNATHLFSLH